MAQGRRPDLRGGDHAVGALGVVGPLDEEEVVPEVERHLALVPLAVHGPHGLHRVAHLRAGGTAASGPAGNMVVDAEDVLPWPWEAEAWAVLELAKAQEGDKSAAMNRRRAALGRTSSQT